MAKRKLNVIIGTKAGLYHNDYHMAICAFAVLEGAVVQGMGDDRYEALCDLALRLDPRGDSEDHSNFRIVS